MNKHLKTSTHHIIMRKHRHCEEGKQRSVQQTESVSSRKWLISNQKPLMSSHDCLPINVCYTEYVSRAGSAFLKTALHSFGPLRSTRSTQNALCDMLVKESVK